MRAEDPFQNMDTTLSFDFHLCLSGLRGLVPRAPVEHVRLLGSQCPTQTPSPTCLSLLIAPSLQTPPLACWSGKA